MSTTQEAAAIRKQLKSELGATSRDVSVRSSSCSIHVTIRNPRFRKADVERIANAFEQISYDHMSGEILCGGNTFVNVDYSDEALAAWRGVITASAAAALGDDADNVLGRGSFAYASFQWNGFWLSSDGSGYWTVTGPSVSIHCWSLPFAIRQLAEAVANGTATMNSDVAGEPANDTETANEQVAFLEHLGAI